MPDPQLENPAPIQDLFGWLTWWRALPGSIRGAILFMFASIVFTIMVGMIKIVGQRLHVTEVLLVRQTTMIVLAAPMIISGWPDSVRSARPGLQLLRIAFAFCAMTFGFASFVELPLAEVTVIAFSKSFFMTILAILILKEVVMLPRWIALAVGFAGVLIIVWPEPGQEINLWHLSALGSAVCVGAVVIIIRILSQLDQPVTILTYQAVGVGVLMIPPAIYFWQTPTTTEWALLIGIGALSVCAQFLNILSIRAAEASLLAPLEYTRLVFAAILGLWLFDEWPSERVWLGAFIIVCAAVYVVHREHKARKRDAANATLDSAASGK